MPRLAQKIELIDGKPYKLCTACLNKKLTSEFAWNQKRSNGLHSQCRECEVKFRSKYSTESSRRKWHLKQNYKITPEEYNQLLESQNFVCAICGNKCETRKNLSIDHDHDSTTIRGLLCNNCNVGLGRFKDNIELLEKAISYLKKFELTISDQEHD